MALSDCRGEWHLPDVLRRSALTIPAPGIIVVALVFSNNGPNPIGGMDLLYAVIDDGLRPGLACSHQSLPSAYQQQHQGSPADRPKADLQHQALEYAP